MKKILILSCLLLFGCAYFNKTDYRGVEYDAGALYKKIIMFQTVTRDPVDRDIYYIFYQKTLLGMLYGGQ